MKKFSLYHYAIAAGVLLLAVSLHHYHTNEKDRSVFEASVSPITVTPSIAAPAPTETVVALDDLCVRDTVITIGDSTEDIIHKLGRPGRIAATEHGFDYYIYNNDYHRLAFIAVKEGKVIGFYTDSEDFSFHKIKYGATLKEVNSALKEHYEDTEVITYHTSAYTAQILFDTLDTKSVTGVYVLSEEVKNAVYTEAIRKEIELIAYDLTNSMRVRNGVPALSWSSSAAQAARKHSISMATYHYFSHKDPERRTPGSRLHAEGISYNICGETITAGYENVILACYAEYNSVKQRSHILNPQYRYIGAGFTYDKDSIYKTYLTQSFYR